MINIPRYKVSEYDGSGFITKSIGLFEDIGDTIIVAYRDNIKRITVNDNKTKGIRRKPKLR